MYDSQGKKQPLTLSYLAYSRQKKRYAMVRKMLNSVLLSLKGIFKVVYLQVLFLCLQSAFMEYCTLSDELFAVYFIHLNTQHFNLISQWTLIASRMVTLYIVVISCMLSEINLSCINLHRSHALWIVCSC